MASRHALAPRDSARSPGLAAVDECPEATRGVRQRELISRPQPDDLIISPAAVFLFWSLLLSIFSVLRAAPLRHLVFPDAPKYLSLGREFLSANRPSARRGFRSFYPRRRGRSFAEK